MNFNCLSPRRLCEHDGIRVFGSNRFHMDNLFFATCILVTLIFFLLILINKEEAMGTLSTLIKIVAAPVYIPYKIAKKCSEPSKYEYWYHDSGNPTCDDRNDKEKE